MRCPMSGICPRPVRRLRGKGGRRSTCSLPAPGSIGKETKFEVFWVGGCGGFPDPYGG